MMLSALWIGLGGAIVVAMVIDAAGLLSSESSANAGIWISLTLGTALGLGAIVFGVRTRKMQAWVRLLGYVLCLLLGAYTLYILLITPQDALWRPFLLVQVFVLLLSVGTVIYLARASIENSSAT